MVQGMLFVICGFFGRSSKLANVLWERRVNDRRSWSVFVAHCTTSHSTAAPWCQDNFRIVCSPDEDCIGSTSGQSAEEDRQLPSSGQVGKPKRIPQSSDSLESGTYVNVNILPRLYADVMKALVALPRGTV